MNPDDPTKTVIAPLLAGRLTAPAWVFDELRFVQRETQAQAELAYQRWRVEGGRDAYLVYRAAQDRADAAQDDLARVSARRVAHPGA